jgi:predicted component of type VI protein secretion system
MVLGRAPKCDVVLKDTKASRRHARVVVEGSVTEIEDLESSNGTFLNGNQIRRRLLRDGDEITIGTTALRFREFTYDGVVDDIEPESTIVASRPDEMHQPRGGLEGDPLADAPVAASERGVRDDDVEVLEFVDEVVEVKAKPQPAPAPASPAASPRVASRGAAGARKHGVLQFSSQSAKGGVLGDDMRQMSRGRRLLLIVVALAVSVGLGYLVMVLIAGS